MLSLRSVCVLICGLVAPLAAQSSYTPGFELVAWSNSATIGSPVLDAMVHYPALTTGYAAPKLPRSGGWPTVVFLHGYDKIGLDYHDLGQAWASAGIVVVMLNTARTDGQLLVEDAQVTPAAIAAENTTVGAPFAGMFAIHRLGIAGHSMGGGLCAVAQRANPVYAAGLALAPVDPSLAVQVAGVTIPFGIVVGEGDAITPPQWHSRPFFEALGTADGLKFLYLLNQDCSHTNIAGLDQVPTAAVFPRVADISASFFQHFLAASPTAFERCNGPDALAEPRLIALDQEISLPQVWASSRLRIGGRVRFSVAVEWGNGGLLIALGQGAALPTPFGSLLLDPSSMSLYALGFAETERRIDAIMDVPNDPQLIGFELALQGFGPSASSPFILGAAVTLRIEP